MKKLMTALALGAFSLASFGVAESLITGNSGNPLAGSGSDLMRRTTCTASTSTLPKIQCTVTAAEEYQARRQAVDCCRNKGGGNFCTWVTCR